MSRLSNKGYSIPKSNFTCDEINEIKSSLSVKAFNSFDDSNDKIIQVYLENNKRIYLPKFWSLQKFGIPDSNTVSSYSSIHPKFIGSLRENQIRPVEIFLDSCNDERKRGGILQLPPGWGKTVMALNIISKLKVKTLIIVHKEFLMNQWIERIQQYVDNVTIGIVKQKKIETNNDIVIASLQSLCIRDYDSGTFRDFGLTVIDECHHMGAEVFSRAFFKTTTLYTLGLSATVSRKDGLTKIFKYYIGDVIFKAKTKKDPTDIVHVKLKHFDDKSLNYCNVPLLFNGKVNFTKMISNITSFSIRTQFIVDEIKNILESEPDRQILVLSERRNHLEDIHTTLKLQDINSAYYVGGMKQSELKKSEASNIILGTYNMVSEGFDLPKLNTLILASPKSDVEQSVGRIQRQLASERAYNPLIIDVIDSFSVFKNQSKKREMFYKKNFYHVEGKVDDKKKKQNNCSGEASLPLNKFAFKNLE